MTSTSSSNQPSSDADSPPTSYKNTLRDSHNSNADSAEKKMDADQAEVKPSTSSSATTIAPYGCNDTSLNSANVALDVPEYLKNMFQRIEHSQNLSPADKACTSVADHLEQPVTDSESELSKPAAACLMESNTTGSNSEVAAAISMDKMEVDEDGPVAGAAFAKDLFTACAFCGCNNPTCRRGLKTGRKEVIKSAGSATETKR